uniref:Putative disease resistance RPP13-like protein 1 n=2 Tax=Davidia involucrata TaxID=16924 RepID=A0A5B6Z1K5_DAVIN
MSVGDAFLSAFLQVAFDRLASRKLLDFAQYWKVDVERKNLIRTLRKINAVLNDAEDKQSKDMAVKEWLDELTDVAYDAEVVIDEFATEALRWKLLEGSVTTQASTEESQVWSFNIPASFSHFMFNVDIKYKIKAITERLDDIAKERHDLGLRDGVQGRSYGFQERLPTTSLVNESDVYGRDEEKEKIIDMLLRDDQEPCRHNKISVIPIVGMGGVGKTTLAQLLYNDDRVNQHFNMKAWACVSDEFDVMTITMAILESATKRSYDFKNLEPLQDSLKNELNGKKFLLVLDDVWNKKYTNWDVLKKPFSAGAQGSKIIVTTRNNTVASIMGTVPTHCLKHLRDDDCWSLFKKHAFENTNTGHQPKLESIGRKIVKKCKGLPLAAKTLGGLLRCKVEEDEWEDILNSELWELPAEESDIMPALKLSYHHLPTHLKRCFAYCAIFPKDFEFEQEDLVLLWMAEGLLQQSKGMRKEMEDLGRVYFSELLSMSFFQQSNGYKGRFVMHDLINDLAQCVTGDVCFKLEDDRQNGTLEKARHSSYARSQYDGFKKFEPFYKVKGLRTLLSLPLRGFDYSPLSNRILPDLLPNLRCLRALSLTGYYITELPDSIGDLKLLRYLNLSDTYVKSLPHSTSNLYNLQSLLLYNCRSLSELPSNMRNLVNLRHLGIRKSKLQEMPLQMGKLTNLRTLREFVVGKGSGSGIGELGDLLHLRRLSIRNLKNVIDTGDAMKANLMDKKDLDEVEMEWSSEFDDTRNGSVETDMLNVLRPHRNLQLLVISFYGGTGFPSWIGDPSFSNITDLELDHCKNCTSLPPVGVLPSLKNLAMREMIGVKHVGVELYGAGIVSVKPFPSLESLQFEGLLEWEEWFFPSTRDDFEIFPRLLKLSIRNCPKLLRKLPGHLPSLEELVIFECPQLTVSLPNLPSSCEIDIKGCKEIAFTNSVDLTSCTYFITRLELINCDIDALMSLLNEGRLEHVVDLKFVSIKKCPQFLTFPNLCLLKTGPANLRLLFSSCSSLTSFPSIILDLYIRDFKYSLLEGIMHINNTSLGYLHINWCPSLTSFPKDVLPATLETLRLCNCENLESLSEVTMPSNMSLRHFHVINCRNLKSLPEGLHNLTRLETMEINECHSLVSLPDGWLPASLVSLSIVGCNNLNLMPLSEWGLHQLTSLRELTLGGGCPDLVSFPECLLPTSLTSLSVQDLPNLETLSIGFQYLTSFKQLQIAYCPKIKFLPGEELLAGLSALNIWNCPVLKERCKKGKGEDWPKIAHIPFIQINGLRLLQNKSTDNCP